MAQWAYITPKQLVYMTPARIAQLYQEFKDDMPGNLRKLQNEVDHWKAIREMVNVAEKPDTLDNSINQPRPILQHVHCCHSTDGDVYVLTAMADRPYRAMLHLKNYQRSTITTERLSGLALMHVHKDRVGC